MDVQLIAHTGFPEQVCSLAASTCVSSEPTISKNPSAAVERVLNYGHESIAEHASFTFLIKGISRACSHQLVRYRQASYAQQSQRYVALGGDMEEEYYFTPESIKNSYLSDAYANCMADAKGLYQDLLDAGIQAEDARYVLPNATNTNITMTLNASEIRHIARQRLCTRAQWEIRDLVGVMINEVNKVAPAFVKGIGPACLNGKCPEGKLSCGKPWS